MAIKLYFDCLKIKCTLSSSSLSGKASIPGFRIFAPGLWNLESWILVYGSGREEALLQTSVKAFPLPKYPPSSLQISFHTGLALAAAFVPLGYFSCKSNCLLGWLHASMFAWWAGCQVGANLQEIVLSKSEI